MRKANRTGPVLAVLLAIAVLAAPAAAGTANPALNFKVYINGERAISSGQEKGTSKAAYIDESGRIQVSEEALRTLEDYGVYAPNDGEPEEQDFDGRIFPLRAVLEAQGAVVSWDGSSRRADVSIGSGQGTAASAPVYEDGLLTVHFLDVGQGDAAFIDYGNFEVLIDAGGNAMGDTVVSYIDPYVDESLDLIIATHPHADHIGGMDTVITAFEVDRIIDSGDTWDTNSYRDYRAAAEEEADCLYESVRDMTIDLGGGANLRLIDVPLQGASVNDNSIIALLTYDQVQILFMADVGKMTELKVLEKLPEATVLKVGHHGSNTSSGDAFLSAVKPETAVISASLHNQYGHPNKWVLKRLFDAGTTVYGTFKSGTILLTTDGISWEFSAAGGVPMALTEQDAGVVQLNRKNMQEDLEIRFVGNTEAQIYHVATCPYGEAVSEENRVYFTSRDEAEEYDYEQCKWCRLLQEVINSVY